MKHLILDNNTILQIGDDYTTPRDEDIFIVKGETQPVHRLDGNQYDYNAFTHVEVAEVPQNIAPYTHKYVDGQFAENVDYTQVLRQEGYDNAINELIEEGVL